MFHNGILHFTRNKAKTHFVRLHTRATGKRYIQHLIDPDPDELLDNGRGWQAHLFSLLLRRTENCQYQHWFLFAPVSSSNVGWHYIFNRALLGAKRFCARSASSKISIKIQILDIRPDKGNDIDPVQSQNVLEDHTVSQSWDWCITHPIYSDRRYLCSAQNQNPNNLQWRLWLTYKNGSHNWLVGEINGVVGDGCTLSAIRIDANEV